MKKKICAFFVICMSVCLAMSLTACSKDYVRVKSSAQDYKGKNYKTVFFDLIDAEFTNIELKEIKDIPAQSADLDGTVESVIIGDSSDFKRNDKFRKDIKVVITFHKAGAEGENAAGSETEAVPVPTPDTSAANVAPTPTPTPASTPRVTVVPTATPRPTATPKPKATPRPSREPIYAVTPTPKPTAAPVAAAPAAAPAPAYAPQPQAVQEPHYTYCTQCGMKFDESLPNCPNCGKR